MTVILLNCATLGMFQPCEDTVCDTKRCKILKVISSMSIGASEKLPILFLQICDDVIYLYFTVEMVIKMLAMGIVGKGCYLSETWNRLDFFIVMAGLVRFKDLGLLEGGEFRRGHIIRYFFIGRSFVHVATLLKCKDGSPFFSSRPHKSVSDRPFVGVGCVPTSHG